MKEISLYDDRWRDLRFLFLFSDGRSSLWFVCTSPTQDSQDTIWPFAQSLSLFRALKSLKVKDLFMRRYGESSGVPTSARRNSMPNGKYPNSHSSFWSIYLKFLSLLKMRFGEVQSATTEQKMLLQRYQLSQSALTVLVRVLIDPFTVYATLKQCECQNIFVLFFFHPSLMSIASGVSFVSCSCSSFSSDTVKEWERERLHYLASRQVKHVHKELLLSRNGYGGTAKVEENEWEMSRDVEWWCSLLWSRW